MPKKESIMSEGMNEVKHEGIIMKKLAALSHLLDQLETSMNTFESSLRAISRDVPPQKNETGKNPVEGTSEIAVSLQVSNERIEKVLDRLNDQWARLEL